MPSVAAAIACAALVCAVSLALGRGVMKLAWGAPDSWLAAPVGLAAALVLAGIAARLPGRGATAAVVVIALAAVSLALTVPRTIPRRAVLAGSAVLALAGVVAAIPFIVNGRVGPLGQGLVNDDMASHLVMADWVQNHEGPEPPLVADGYPLGPHSVVAALAEGLGTGPIEGFAGLSLAIAMLAALLAFGVLEGLSPPWRLAGSVLAALPYLAASYLAQGAYKEPLQATLLIGFVLALPRATAAGPSPAFRLGNVRVALPLGILAAGAVFNYSFPGLIWLGAAALAWLVLVGIRERPQLAALARAALPAAAAAAAIVIAANVLELGRIAEFADFKGFDPGTDGLGNLAHPISPLESLGIWPGSDFRLSAADATAPAPLFYLGGALAALAVAIGLARAWRGNRPELPAALAAAIALYLAALAGGTAYTGAKALAVVAPVAMLIALRGVLTPPRGPGVRLVGAGFAIAATACSLLSLRAAAVGPHNHLAELESLRPLVAGENVLFLGRDNFVLYGLRGSRPFTHVQNYYDPYFVRPNPRVQDAGLKFDFDSVGPKTLGQFPFVITTRAAYASGPPPVFEPLRETESYVLWRRAGTVGPRRTLDEAAEPGAVLRCPARRGTATIFAAEPVRSDGTASERDLDLPPGRWEISLQYDATRPLRVQGPGLEVTLPGNLDFRGPGPFWRAGTVRVGKTGQVRITTSVERPPFLGRLLGAEAVAHVTAVAATRAGGLSRVPLARACGEYVDWYRPR